MKISILPFEKTDKNLDTIVIHNLVKRSEEDLRAIYPDLKEFIVKIQVYQSYSRYNSVQPGSYSLLENETAVRLNIATYPMQEPQVVYDHVSKQLQQIKNNVGDFS